MGNHTLVRAERPPRVKDILQRLSAHEEFFRSQGRGVLARDMLDAMNEIVSLRHDLDRAINNHSNDLTAQAAADPPSPTRPIDQEG